jgi:hypothetical protein
MTMVEDTSRRERFSFRFIALSDAAVDALRRALPDAPLRTRKHDTHTTAVIDLSETLDLDPLYAFIDESGAPPSSYGVWISVVTASDHSGVSVPPHVLDLIRRTRGGVDFSFVALGPDDHDSETPGPDERPAVATS